MKKNKTLMDAVLLSGLAVLALIAINPTAFVMPTALQMILLAVVMALLAGFILLLWREDPVDEREVQNQAFASRLAYIVGSAVLIFALLVQSLDHDVDPFIPLTLIAMIGTKVLTQRIKDN